MRQVAVGAPRRLGTCFASLWIRRGDPRDGSSGKALAARPLSLRERVRVRGITDGEVAAPDSEIFDLD
jgi:hypothetical protein